MLLGIFFYCLMALSFSEKVSYRNYKVYKTVPTTAQQLEALKALSERVDYDFWSDPLKVESDVMVMVSPSQSEEFLDYLEKYQIISQVKIADVQNTIDAQRVPASQAAREHSSHCQCLRRAGSLTWDEYHDLNAIYTWLDELPALFPGIVETVVIGYSNSGKEIKGVIIDYHPEIKSTEKLIGMFEGGIHAREWISPATVTWIIKEFLTSTDPAVRSMAETFQWHIFPVTNPDGYEYTFESNRMWRKNRNFNHTTACGQWGIADDTSNGIDLNRNFNYLWMSVGASNNPCAETYAGWSGFSEPETRAIADYATALQAQGTLIYYITFHSYSQMLLLPYSHVVGAEVLAVDNYADLFEIGVRAMDALKARHGVEYVTGTSAEILYAVSGSSFDWVKGVLNVPIVYLYELRDTGTFGFLLPTEQIIPNGQEVVDSLVEIHRVAAQLGYYKYTAGADKITPFAVWIVAALVALGFRA